MNDSYILTKDKPPKEQLKKLTNLASRQEIAEFAQAINITWKPADNSNINWMRCSMAIQNNFSLFCNSWNEHINLQYKNEIAEEVAVAIEDKSPEYLYHSGDFYPKELLNISSAQFYEGYEFDFLGENTQIDRILNENSESQYFFSHKNKIVSLNNLEMNNLYLIEQFIKRGFVKTYLTHAQVGFGNPVKFWNKSQYTLEQQLQKYYLDTVLVYKNEKYSFKFTKTKEGWRYLSLCGKLCWFTTKELDYIVSKLKLAQKQFP